MKIKLLKKEKQQKCVQRNLNIHEITFQEYPIQRFPLKRYFENVKMKFNCTDVLFTQNQISKITLQCDSYKNNPKKEKTNNKMSIQLKLTKIRYLLCLES